MTRAGHLELDNLCGFLSMEKTDPLSLSNHWPPVFICWYDHVVYSLSMLESQLLIIFSMKLCLELITKTMNTSFPFVYLFKKTK